MSEQRDSTPSDRPAPKHGAPTETSPRRSRAGSLAALVTAAVLVLGAVFWLSARRQASAASRDLSTAASALAACFHEATSSFGSLPSRLAHSFPDERPLASCAPHLDSARALHARLAAIRPLADREGVDEVGQWLAGLDKITLDATARDLVSFEPESLEARVVSLARAACRVAIAQSADADVDCAAESPTGDDPTPPAARAVIDERTGFLEHVAFGVDVRGNRHVTLLAATTQRDAARVLARLAVSSDGGASWRSAALEGETALAGHAQPPRAVFHASGFPRYFLLAQSRAKLGLTGGTVGRVTDDRLTLRFERDLPELPVGMEPVSAGSPLFELASGRFAVALAPRDADAEGGGLLVLGEKPSYKPLSNGRLVAALAGPPARVLVRAREGGEFVYVEQQLPGENDSKWPAATGARLRASPATLLPIPERRCGAPGEKFAPFVARDAQGAALLSLGDTSAIATPFTAPASGELSLACGSCPPSLLAKSETGLGLIVPAGSKLISIPVPTPVLYSSSRSWRSTAATCSATSYAVAYIEAGRLYVQAARSGSWQFSHPQLLAAPNDAGEPEQVVLAGLDRRLLAIWRRRDAAREQLRIEVLASDDGGQTWR